MNRAIPLFLCCLAVFHGCSRSAPPNVAATVNGRSITFAELDKQYQMQFGNSPERPSDDQVLVQRLEVLRTLIDNEILLQRAEQMGLLAVDSDVDAKYAEMKRRTRRRSFRNSSTT